MWMDRSTPTAAILFAQLGKDLRRNPPPASPWEIWLAFGSLVGAVALGCWAIYRVKRWREESAQEELLSPQQLIDHYQKMVDDGLLDPEEFAQIKARMEKPIAPAQASPPPVADQPPDNSFFEK
jgi:hypothetical protein